MGIRMMGLGSGMDYSKIVDKLMAVEKQPIDAAKKRKEGVANEKKELDKLDGLVTDFDNSLNGLKTREDFYKLKVESSNPDIIDGTVKGAALPGNYEFEVRSLAKSDKQLAYGFPDKDKTPVGFGYMTIEREDKGPVDIVIDPGSTLEDVATKINDADAGVRAMVVNTKYKPNPYRLLVVSEKSGQEAKINIDEDTTFLEFKNQVAGRNLDVLFEDVPVTGDSNVLDELVDGVVFNVKRAEPGTRVQVNVTYDVDKTLEGIKGFIDKYNKIAQYVHDQFVVDPETNRAGPLAGESAIKTILRQLQSGISDPLGGGKYRTLADIGITTNPKSGTLDLSESKVKQALSEDYDGVAKLFVATGTTMGVAGRLADEVRGIKDPVSGVLKSREQGLENIMKNQDKDIERRERQMEQREQSLRQRFTALDSQMAQLNSQKDFLSQRFGGGGGGGGQGASE